MPRRKLVAIHQPNFFPWLGYFNKLAHADVFVLLDNVQFPKTGGTWANRVRILINGEPAWLTMPIVRSYHGTRLISEMKINNAISWRDKMLKTLQMNYARAPFFDEVLPFISDLANNPTDSLVEFNQAAIRAMAEPIGLDISKYVVASTLNVYGTATDLLISIIKTVSGTAYLCGGGAANYQEDEKFNSAGLELIYQNFQHPLYPQVNANKFTLGLSIIDALMNLGFDGCRLLLKARER